MGCGGTLSEEQRKQMREARELQSIKKVSDAELQAAAFATGRKIMSALESNPALVDSMDKQHQVHIHWLETGSTTGSEIEKQLIDAYLNSMMLGEELADNVQRIGNDSLLYTKPVVVERKDGVVEVKGTWNIRMSKKQLVLAMDSP